MLVLVLALVLAPLAAHADELARIDGTHIVLATPLTFASGTSTLTPSDAHTLAAIAAILSAHPSMTIEIGVHTDSRGADSFNRAMSQQRADAVRMALMARGISGTRMTAIGYGESRPIADDVTEAGRAANRRVEITIVRT